MTFTLFSAAMLGIMALIIYGQARKGYKSGLNKSLINLASVFFSAIFGTVISVGLSSLIENLTVWILQVSNLYGEIEELADSYMAAILLVSKMILSLLIFIPVFYILKFIINLIAGIILRKCIKKSRALKTEYLPEDAPLYVRHGKKLGTIMGVISGFIIAVVLFMPFTGVLKTADKVVKIVEGYDMPEGKRLDPRIFLISKYSDEFSVNLVYACGGDILFDLTARAEIYGIDVSLSDEIDSLSGVDINRINPSKISFSNLSPELIHDIEKTLEEINKSTVFKVIAAEFVKNVSESWANGNSYYNVKKPNFSSYAAVDNFMNELYLVCSTTDFYRYEADLETLFDIMEILIECKNLMSATSYRDIITELHEKNILQRIDDELIKNPHMSVLSSKIDDMLMSILSSEVQKIGDISPAAKKVVCREISDAINNTKGLTGSVKTVALSNYLSQSFKDYGVYVPESFNSRISNILVSQISDDRSEVTEEDIENLFFRYASELYK